MKKILFFLLSVLFCARILNAQNNTDNNLALQVVDANKTSLGLSTADLSNVIVIHTYLDKTTGLRMVYLQQTYLGIPVHNQILVLAFRDGKLVSNAGVFNHSVEKYVNVNNIMPSVTAESAVQSAIADRKLTATEPPILIDTKNNGQKIEFNSMGVSRENITAELMWVAVEETVSNVTKLAKVKLAWQVYIIQRTSSDYWRVRIDANDRSTVSIDNLTDYDNWGHADGHTPSENSVTAKNQHQEGVSANHLSDNKKIDLLSEQVQQSAEIINTATFRVIPFPAESPQAPGGGHALRIDPWLAAPGNATTLKWNTGAGAADYDYTRGNNVWAYEDRTAPTNTGTIAKSASSTTALPNLTFNFTPDFTVTPLQTTPVQNQQFNITNLFYWCNVIHDVMYQYGFTEAARNFQDDNMGRGGVGNDHVNGEAQDASGTNNANFATPADGGSGRMQMFLWNINGSNPVKDGDVDNGIIVHEFGHGISNRLTGAGVGCVQNAEHMGEGWSDYYSLMFTQDWATSTLNTGFNTPRGIGLYALNNVNLFPASPPNTGIRHFPYCTNFAVNSQVYLASLPTSPHDRGEIWCATLWDMTWNIINQVGVINPNLYNVAGGGGNVIAMRLVTEGLKLQQCSPGFISGRNAILAADQALYGGAYRCAIIQAFARRGMGTNASEGSTTSVTDQVVDFSGGGPTLLLTQNGTVSVPEGQNIVYNNAITAECAAISNYVLRDTLPLNVSFVSANNGGTYNAGTRVVSWPVNLAANATGNYGFTVNINAGAYFPPVILIDEPVPSTTISGFWTTASTTANVWIAHNTRSKSAPNSFFTPDAAVVSDQTIATTASFALGATPPTLSFWHWYNTEGSWDGGVLEISTNGGTSYTDIGSANFTQNGYNGTLNASTNPLSGRPAWNGNSAAFVESKVSLAPYANQPNVKLRWRLGSDASVGATGWNVDDIKLQTIAVVNMRSSLFDASNVRVKLSDTVTVILPPVATAPTVTINQAALQADPTSVSPINFTAVFSEPVTGFTNTDVILSGTAGATTVVVTGGPATYNVAVSGMTGGGTVLATIPANAATGATLGNLASTSTDNQVIYNPPIVPSGCTPGAAQTFTNTTPVAIPTGPAVVTSTITVAGAPVYLYDLNVLTSITHTFPGDLDITITSPTGTVVTLTTDNASTNDDVYNGTTWDDDANPAGQVPYTNNNGLATDHLYAISTLASPLAPEEPLGAFIGENPNGTWTITISDDAAGDAGSLATWSLVMTGLAAPPILVTTNAANTTPVPISSETATVVTSTIVVAGAGTQIFDVNALTNLTHTFASDLDITLTSPAGTVVTLTTDNGGSNDNVFNGTIWDDDANPAGQVPYTTNNGMATDNAYVNLTPALMLTPEEALAAFLGEDPNGTWTLTISDDANGDGGSLDSWSLAIQTSTCAPPCTLICPANITVSNSANQCGAFVTFAPTTVGTCGTVTATPASGSLFPIGTTTVNVTSSAGASCSFTVTVNDTQPPTITCPANATVSCAAAVPAPNTASVTASDNCPGVTVVFVSDVVSAQTCANRYTVTRTYRATDVAGNTATCTQIITVNDITPPTMTCPAAVTVSCASAVPAPNVASVTGVSDNCAGVVTVTFVSDVISGQTCANRYTITRTYRATDICGNSATCTQTITVNDVTAPVITCPAAVTVSCASAVPAPNTASVTATDNCAGAITITHVGDVITAQTCANRYTLTRTYRATDVCGNSSTCTQIITVNDVTAPVVTCPAPITATTPIGSCTAVVNFTPTATDNCAGVVTITSVPASGSAFAIGVTPVVVTATDVCGNSSTCTFNVTVIDGQLPVISAQPSNRTVCAGTSATFNVTATNVVTYQWQQYNGTAWVNIAGANASSYTVSGTTVSMNTNSFRVILNGLCTVVTSNAATLYVNPLPTITISANPPPTLLPNQTTTLTATVNPTGGSFVWFKNGTPITGVTGAVLGPLSVDDIGTYNARYTDLNGCVATSGNIVVSGQPGENLWVYPNPNQGVFQVRYFNMNNEALVLNIYNALGQRIYQRNFVTTTAYTRMDVDLGTRFSEGVYIVEVVNSAGKQVGGRRIIVRHP